MRRIVLVLGCAAAVLLPACGDGGAKLAAYEIVSRAAATTVDSGRARFDMTMEASMGGMDVDVSADGVVDMAGQRMSMSMSVPGMPGGGEMQAVMDGAVMYMKVPGATEAFGADTEWVSMDLDRLATAEGVDLSQLQAGANNDPTQVLQALRGASDDVEEVGAEEVRGVATTHYRGTMDLRKAAEQQGVDREQLDRLLAQVGSDTMPMDVWIDDDGRARRMRMSPPTPGSTEATMTIDLFDYGTDEDIQVPPADQVTDITDTVLAQAEAAGVTSD